MTETLTRATDAEVRAWARAAGLEVTERGRVSDLLRAQFDAITREAAGDSTPAPAPPPPPVDGRGPESDSAGPGPAAQETPPRTPPRGARGLRDRAQRALSGGARKPKRRTSKMRAGLERISTARLIERGWDGLARSLQPVNLPVSRCLAWQRPTAGAIFDEAVSGTVVDRILQPIARGEARLEKIGALVGPPVIVMALQLPQNQPVRIVEVVDEQSGAITAQAVPWPLGAMRHQFLLSALVEAMEMCVEAQASLPVEVQAAQAERERKREDMRAVVEMFFAAPPADPDSAAAEEAAWADLRERARGV